MDAFELTSADRCDQCQSQAWVRVWVAAELAAELLFCKHHFERSERRLTELGSVWDDQRDRINKTLDVSA